MSTDDSGNLKIVLEYSEDEDDFFVTKSTTLNTDRSIYMIIDEATKKSTLSFPPSAGLIQKRTIERRVASYIKTGFLLNDKGLKIGANFKLETIGIEEKLPDTLLTHGHTYARSKLVRDEVPDYVEKEDNYIVEAGSAGKVKMASTQPILATDPSTPLVVTTKLKAPEITSEPEPEPEPEPIKSATPTPTSVTESTDKDSPSEGLSVTGNASNNNQSDDALFALGQFVDQFAREGMVVVVSNGDEGRYKIVKLKSLKSDSEIDINYELDGLDLYQV